MLESPYGRRVTFVSHSSGIEGTPNWHECNAFDTIPLRSMVSADMQSMQSSTIVCRGGGAWDKPKNFIPGSNEGLTHHPGY
jgi:hypothetical protein